MGTHYTCSFINSTRRSREANGAIESIISLSKGRAGTSIPETKDMLILSIYFVSDIVFITRD
jgi:hypothetical protein